MNTQEEKRLEEIEQKEREIRSYIKKTFADQQLSDEQKENIYRQKNRECAELAREANCIICGLKYNPKQ